MFKNSLVKFWAVLAVFVLLLAPNFSPEVEAAAPNTRINVSTVIVNTDSNYTFVWTVQVNQCRRVINSRVVPLASSYRARLSVVTRPIPNCRRPRLYTTREFRQTVNMSVEYLDAYRTNKSKFFVSQVIHRPR